MTFVKNPFFFFGGCRSFSMPADSSSGSSISSDCPSTELSFWGDDGASGKR